MQMYYMDKQIPPLITISGPPASGTTTVANLLQEQIDYDVVSGGDIFRRLADESELTLSELTELSETDKSIDKTVDRKLKEVIKNHQEGTAESENGLIVESRLAAWHANGTDAVSVLLTAPVSVRANRIADREETTEELEQRESSEAQRYQEYYDIDITDTTVYDLTFDTTEHSAEEITTEILNYIVS